MGPRGARLFLVMMTLIFSGCPDRGTPPKIGHHYVVRCNILGDDGEIIKAFPEAKLCVFLNDGSFVAATNNPIRLARIGPSGGILWMRDLHVHHQLKLSDDGKRLLTLGAEIREGDLGKVRYDDFLVLSVDTGETLSRWSGYEHRKDLLALVPTLPVVVRPPAGRENLDYLYEYTHFNSIAEIPENPTARKIAAFKKGNILAGLNATGTFAILDPELKSIIWSMSDPMYDGDRGHNTRAFHDLQLLPNGNLLVFNNKLGPSPEPGYFSLREIDPESAKIVWSYPKDEHLQMPVGGGGGVQYLPEGVLFSANFLVGAQESGAGFLIDRSGKIVWSIRQPDRMDATPRADVGALGPSEIRTVREPFQDIKRWDLSEFLRNNKI